MNDINNLINELEEATNETENLRISAMFWTYPNGRDRDPQYIVCWSNGRYETQRVVSKRAFGELREQAGIPVYTDGSSYMAF